MATANKGKANRGSKRLSGNGGPPAGSKPAKTRKNGPPAARKTTKKGK